MEDENNVVVYEPPKPKLERAIQIRDEVKETRSMLASVVRDVNYHSDEYSKYMIRKKSLEDKLADLERQLAENDITTVDSTNED